MIDAMLRLLGGKKYGIVSVPGDPFVRPARARLIWAHNTAQAVQNLGLDAMLAANVQGLPIKFESHNGIRSVRRLIGDLYNIQADYDVRGLYEAPSKVAQLPAGQWALDYDIPRNIFPYCGLLHTRHPVVLSRALKVGLPCVYEDHDEDHNTAFKKLPELVREHRNLRVVVAITASVQERLVSTGVPRERTIVLDSGVNSLSFERQQEASAAIRRSLLRRGIQRIVVYAGGLQPERGVKQLLYAARAMPDCLFLIFGGTAPDQSAMRASVVEWQLSNVLVPGYVPQKQVLAFQQAADALVMTRQADARAAITSPLKFFEYLAAGSPMVAAKLPATEKWADESAALDFYDPAEPETLLTALRRSFASFGWQPQGHSRNIEIARQFTWEQRELALFERLVA
ncbi:glycosyltransferase [Falsiroseomonas ponticola]|uniref:glycosyltransferase n=1 Tax=Falsiroseomonas ponticola TaxID=2786951 RepID=UPI00193188DC|nr:glycosyltransferase [Roseomonas ponticola]